MPRGRRSDSSAVDIKEEEEEEEEALETLGGEEGKEGQEGGSLAAGPHLVSTDYFRFCGTHVGIKSFQGKINLFQNRPEPGIRLESILKILHTVPRIINIQLAD